MDGVDLGTPLRGELIPDESEHMTYCIRSERRSTTLKSHAADHALHDHCRPLTFRNIYPEGEHMF